MKIEQILTELIQSVQAVKDFAIEQASDVVLQLLAWHFWQATISSVISIAVLVAIIIAVRYFIKRGVKEKGPLDIGDSIFVSAMTIILCIAPTVAFVCNAGTALKIWIAPKLWLIEYAASLVQSQSQ